jgi:hypothetical protein
MNEAACPALAELLAREPSAAVAEHAQGCLRCRALLHSSNARAELQREQYGVAAPEQVHPQPGSVVLVAADTTDELLPAVVLTLGDETMTIAPLTAEVAFATEWDLLLGEAALGYRAAAQVWNLGTVLAEQITEAVGRLGERELGQLQALARAATQSARPPADVRVGPPVLSEEDPRLLVQDEQAGAARPFWEPTLALAGAATLGEVVRHRREELGLAAAELARLADGEGWLDTLERDVLDLPRAVPSRSLAALMRRLGVGASRRLREIARATIEAQAPALARGKDVAASRADNERYLDEFMSALEDER